MVWLNFINGLGWPLAAALALNPSCFRNAHSLFHWYGGCSSWCWCWVTAD